MLFKKMYFRYYVEKKSRCCFDPCHVFSLTEAHVACEMGDVTDAAKAYLFELLSCLGRRIAVLRFFLVVVRHEWRLPSAVDL